MRFVQSLGHTTIEIFADNEPATVRLQDALVVARSRLSLKTLKKNPAIGQHQSNGAVERTVDLVRRLACTLLDVVRKKSSCNIGVHHPLFGWAFSHSLIMHHQAAQQVLDVISILDLLAHCCICTFIISSIHEIETDTRNIPRC